MSPHVGVCVCTYDSAYLSSSCLCFSVQSDSGGTTRAWATAALARLRLLKTASTTRVKSSKSGPSWSLRRVDSAFSRLIASLHPLSKHATLKLKHDAVHLICFSDGVQVWSQIQVSAIFDQSTFRLESNSNNEIYLEVSLDALARALKSSTGATEVTIKLAKKGGTGPAGNQGKNARPVLSLAIQSASRHGRMVTITHDVGVRVKKHSEVDAMKEPLCPAPDLFPVGIAFQVNILLPPLSSLRTVSERLKTISSSITISANWRGEFRLRAESDDANVQTEWRGLKHPTPPEDEASQDPPSPSAFHSVTVDARSLLKFLGAYTIATTTIACICEDHCAIFYVYIGDTTKGDVQGGVLTFFVPAASIDTRLLAFHNVPRHEHLGVAPADFQFLIDDEWAYALITVRQIRGDRIRPNDTWMIHHCIDRTIMSERMIWDVQEFIRQWASLDRITLRYVQCDQVEGKSSSRLLTPNVADHLRILLCGKAKGDSSIKLRSTGAAWIIHCSNLSRLSRQLQTSQDSHTSTLERIDGPITPHESLPDTYLFKGTVQEPDAYLGWEEHSWLLTIVKVPRPKKPEPPKHEPGAGKKRALMLMGAAAVAGAGTQVKTRKELGHPTPAVFKEGAVGMRRAFKASASSPAGHDD
ncbi:HUS1 checkpoint protein [Pseudohyphozyma bogoriensis]|nr:HUS1 checkpoint protein [Pseudohyphozyma bogoriensis]